MRPLRFLLLLAFFIVLPVFLTCLSLVQRAKASSEPLGPGFQPKTGRLRALFSFTTPSSLFPPSAVISLTNDNSTFFLARPAAFGPSLPSSGLSAQLWVGKGFGEEISLSQEDIRVNGYELGCSDVPGWDDEHRQMAENGAITSKQLRQFPRQIHKRSAQSRSVALKHNSNALQEQDSQDATVDGTDDHLHRPLPDSNPASDNQPGEPAAAATKSGKISTHADIESLQESADIAGKIVMLSRGGCGFLEKVKWAQRRGGVAVIVGDNQPGGQLTVMYAKGDTSNVTIPSLFTSYNAAHLLSSLVPSEKNEDGADVSESAKPGAQNGRLKSQASPGKFKVQGSTNVKSVRAKQSKVAGLQDADQGWMQNVLSAVGLEDDVSEGDDSRRPPSSGNIDWILLEDWDEEKPRETNAAPPLKAKETKSTHTATKLAKLKSTSTKRVGNDDFVIGVQDWRDTELIAPKSTINGNGAKQNIRPTKSIQQSQPAITGKAAKEVVNKHGFITPGSGEYDHQKHGKKARSEVETSADQALIEDRRSMGEKVRSFFYEAHERKIVHPKPKDYANSRSSSSDNIFSGDETADKTKQEGLWLTLTPTSVSTSPFFDTLLVLVVSPLVTLTIVYGLLLLRSRIRRRRWRAPKSIVERLPVRTYHTIASSSSTTSSNTTSTNPSASASPELRATSARTRPRSQTTTGIISSLPEKGSTNAKSARPKRYAGRQVECVVCLEEYVDGESKVMSLPCGHEFHADCITPWLVTRRRTCPICKGDVVRSFSRSGMGSGSSSALLSEDSRHENEQTSDDIQDRAAETVNEDASAAIPIPARDDGAAVDEMERGDSQIMSTSGTSRAQARGWRGTLSASINRLSGDTVWRSTPNDRAR